MPKPSYSLLIVAWGDIGDFAQFVGRDALLTAKLAYAVGNPIQRYGLLQIVKAVYQGAEDGLSTIKFLREQFWHSVNETQGLTISPKGVYCN